MKGTKKMQDATFQEDQETAYSLIGVATAYGAPISIHIFYGGGWSVESEHEDPWLNQHGCFYVAETIGSKLPSWDCEEPTIVKEHILSVLEDITNEDGTIRGAN
jgi:hypothetical protein